MASPELFIYLYTTLLLPIFYFCGNLKYQSHGCNYEKVKLFIRTRHLQITVQSRTIMEEQNKLFVRDCTSATSSHDFTPRSYIMLKTSDEITSNRCCHARNAPHFLRPSHCGPYSVGLGVRGFRAGRVYCGRPQSNGCKKVPAITAAITPARGSYA